MASAPLTVTELADVIKGTVHKINTVEVTGELSGYKIYPESGHHYFSIKDSTASISCILYAHQGRKLNFTPKDGLRVILKAKPDFYGKTGKLSLVVDGMKPEGEGMLYLKFKALEAKLRAEGLFDEKLKRELPAFPKVVAFVTSETGAVWHDFIEVLKTRKWSGTAWLVPARVQGDQCPHSVKVGLKAAQAIPNIDLIVVGRGGGSAEDLWGFNDESLVRAVRDCKIPIISAVGHQTDFTLCDFAADRRAETPTAAAEIIASGQTKLREQIKYLAAQLALHNPATKIQNYFQDLDLCHERLTGAVEEYLSSRRHQLSELRSELIRLSPKARLGVAQERIEQLQKRLEAAGFGSILARGYSIIRDENGKVVANAKAVTPGKRLKLKFKDGEAEATGN